MSEESNEIKSGGVNESVIYIGNKPPMSYVLAVITEFKKEGDGNDVVIKARGRAISRAVDTAEIVRKRFLPDIDVKEIKIDTESVTDDTGTTHNISSIEIRLGKK